MAERKKATIFDPVSLESQERLAEIMNDSTRKALLGGTEWEIRALRPGTQWLIAQEAVSIDRAGSANFSDIIKQFATNIPSVVKVITLGLLNDREKIFANGKAGKFSELYETTYNTVMWDTKQTEWMTLLVEILQMLDVEVFFSLTELISMTRQRLLERKTTMEEQKQLLQERNSGK